ncbi:MAG: matrixin family metalloprotease [Polyangiales bacterium]
MKFGSPLALTFAAAGLVWLSSSPAHAYTINTTEVGKPIRWAVDAVRLQVDPEFEAFLADGEARSALTMSFDAWRGLPRVPDLLIQPGKPESLGHHDGRTTNGVYLLRDWPYEASKLAVTIVTYEMDTGRLLDSDIVVNGQARFALLDEPVQPGAAEYDLAGVLAHEAGHVLGLGESDSGQDATMWPYAKPDDTDKRTLAADDEDGAIDSYLSAPPSAASGCGPSTVGGRASGRHGLALGVWMLALVVWLRLGRGRRARASVALCTACALSLGFDAFDDAEGTEPPAEEAAVTALERLMREGTRDDRARLERIASRGDAELARRARYALGIIAARPSAAHVSASLPEAAQRITRLRGTSRELAVGRAQRVATIEESGRLFTEYRVQLASGRSTSLRVAGGIKNGIGQRVIDAEPPPADDQEVVIAEQADGSRRWAYHQRGLVFGGELGEGAAIEGAL